jgi:hypothetical protein
VTDSWPTSVLGIINIPSIDVTVTAGAVADHDSAFILNLDHTPSKLHAWTVSKLSGDAFLASSVGQQIMLGEGSILNPGNKIRTGQSGRVLLVRGHETILIASNSVIGIPKHVRGMSTTIYQWAGSILFAGNHKQFDVETPHLDAVVRGTRFRVTVNKDGSSIEVLRGQVEVTDFKSGQHALVLPGQAANVLAQGSLGLSLNGALNPILPGVPRKSLDPIDLSDQLFSVQKGTPRDQVYIPPKAENESVPPSSEKDHFATDDSQSSVLGALRRFFSSPEGQRVDAIFGIVFTGALGAASGLAAYVLLRSGDKQKPRNARLVGRFHLPSSRSRMLKWILRK